MNAGEYIVTDDRGVESHLTTVAKQMLWHPIDYIVLILPLTVARVSTFSGASIPSAGTIFTAALCVLTKFVNTVLFYVICNGLDGGWRQRFGIGTMSASDRVDQSEEFRLATRRVPREDGGSRRKKAFCCS